MMQRITLAIVLAAGILCSGQTAQAQTTGYYYGYYYYWGGTAYPIPQQYYYYYPAQTYAPAPVWFTPPAPAPVINVTINVNPTPAVVTPVVPVPAPAPVREWKTVYPVWSLTLLRKERGDEFWLGKEQWKLHEGPEVPSLPSKRMPTELFVSTYSRDSMHFLEYHHIGGKTSLFKKVK